MNNIIKLPASPEALRRLEKLQYLQESGDRIKLSLDRINKLMQELRIMAQSKERKS